MSLWLMAFFVVVSLAGFFLFPSGKINNFPTYLVVLICLAHVCLWPRDLKLIVRSRVGGIGQALLAYLLLATLLSTSLDEAVEAGKYALLISPFLFALQLCVHRLVGFASWLSRLVVLSGLISALHVLVGGEFWGVEVPWGRLRVANIAAIAYGLAGVFAFATFLSVFDNRKGDDRGAEANSPGSTVVRRITAGFWAGSTAVLFWAAARFAENYILFGVVTASLVVCIAFAWSQRFTPRVTLWLPVIAVMLGVQMTVFSSVAETERAVIWHAVTDRVFEQGSILGAGLQDAVHPVVGCDSTMLTGSFDDCRVDHPHSIYVSTLHHGGVPGLGLLVLLLLVSLSEILEAPASELRNVALVTLVFGATVLMFDGSSVVQKIDFVWLLFWLPVGLASGIESRGHTYLGFQESLD